ncbi:DUF2332 domain-containing protein [Solibacillus sp. FSL W7-1464]|uniref:DUF2332 domain-containing protein n=1 Tax=Solibacillus sp. FSL W7-1464 TaxID=2921706 RepID=UPI0030F9E0E7
MEKLVAAFRRFASHEAKNNSPLYEYWCERIITNGQLLNLMMHIPETQPKPNLFFGSVQYLSAQKETPLKQIFENPYEVNMEESFQLLIDFCIQHSDELLQLFQTKSVQTNEVQRASYLYPIFSEISEETKQPLTLIEIGTSAGLLLNLDGYRYEIDQEPPISFGNENSPLTLFAKNYGTPITSVENLDISQRIGIDLNIINLQDSDEFLWLKSLIWPEQIERKENLEKARTINRQYSKLLLNGDFRIFIPSLFDTHDLKDSQIIILHTHVANQFSAKLKAELLAMLQQLSHIQSIYHIYNNMDDADLHVDFIDEGITKTVKILENTDGHGKFFLWNQLLK